MNIREIRGSLQQDSISSFHSAPDWACRHVYEKRHGLPLSKIGRPTEFRSLAEINKRYKTPAATSVPAVSEAQRNTAHRQALALRINNLSQ
jgi:hypothetical protein